MIHALSWMVPRSGKASTLVTISKSSEILALEIDLNSMLMSLIMQSSRIHIETLLSRISVMDSTALRLRWTSLLQHS